MRELTRFLIVTFVVAVTVAVGGPTSTWIWLRWNSTTLRMAPSTGLILSCHHDEPYNPMKVCYAATLKALTEYD